MTDRPDLLEALLADPTDTARLLVYSDWLHEQGDPRADYARKQLELRQTGDRERVLAELRALYPVDHPVWVGRLELAGVFEPRLVEIDEMWWGVGLGARATMATYQGFAYHQQPPIPFERFDGTFAWLRSGAPEDPRPEIADPWRAKIASLRERGFSVPAAFERFMTDFDLWPRIPSCTDNFFLRADDAEEHVQPDGAVFLTFYSDSQSCVLWGIRLGRDGDRYAPVLAGPPEFPDEEPTAGEPTLRFPELTFSAPTFESFVYRWWLENEIWFATQWDPGRPLTDEEAAYLAHLADVVD